MDRRIFIRDAGRGILGISIGGLVLSACGDDEPAVTSQVAATDPPSTTQPTTTTTQATTTTEPTTTTEEATTTTVEAPGPTTAPTGDLSVEAVNLGFVYAYLMVRGQDVAIVDTGGGGRAGDIEAALSTVGLGWNNVNTVVLTHRHGDHVGSLAAIIREVASNVTLGTGEADISGISSTRELIPFADGETVFGSTIVATPGHTPGHISVWDAATRVLVAGDAINGSGTGLPNVDGVAGPNPQFTPDMSTAMESTAKLAALEPDTIFFGHGTPKRGDAAAALNQLVAEF